MKSLTAILRKIAKRRKLHTQRFERFDFEGMKRKDCDVKGLWHEYTLTAEGLRRGHRCFNCNKMAAELLYLMPVGNVTEQEYFCSQTCREQFGILKGTT